MKPKSMKPSFFIKSLGCKVNQYDGAVLRRLLKTASWQEIELIKEAKSNLTTSRNQPTVVIINTCSVTKKAIVKDRQLINEYQRLFPESNLVIMGCWPQTDKKISWFFKNKSSVVNHNKIIFWGVGNLSVLVKNLVKLFGGQAQNITSTKKGTAGLVDANDLLAPTDRSRYFLKVGDGCNQFCAYCLIPFARGPLNSRLSHDIITEAKLAIKAGYREIVLSGIHLGCYGQDLSQQSKSRINLTRLIKQLLSLENLGRLRLSSIEINEIDEGLIRLLKSNNKLCRHLHISLQSGSDKILKLMKRPYQIAIFKNKIKKIKKHIPEIAISTDIIVGFPQETEIDFKNSCALAKELGFSKIHVFPFSAHEQTVAFKLDGHLKPSVIKQRALKLRQLSLKLETNYQNKIKKIYQHQPLFLIKEQSSRRGFWRVKTEFGFDLFLKPNIAKKHIFV